MLTLKGKVYKLVWTVVIKKKKENELVGAKHKFLSLGICFGSVMQKYDLGTVLRQIQSSPSCTSRIPLAQQCSAHPLWPL